MSGVAIRPLDFEYVRDEWPDRWTRAKADNPDVERLNDALWAVEFPDGDEHEVSLYEGDADPVGFCDCEHMEYNPGQGPCAHLIRVKMKTAIDHLEIPPAPGGVIDAETDDDEPEDVEIASTSPTPDQAHEAVERDLPDPLEVVPDYMLDTIQGTPVINKRGYAVIANRYDLVVQAEPVVWPHETDGESATFQARAWPRGGDPETEAYTGVGTANAGDYGSDDPEHLAELAETRAMKRALAWASGMGINAWEEIVDSLDEDDGGQDGA